MPTQPRENRQGQAKGATAADVAGPTSTVGAGGTETPGDVTTKTIETPVHSTAGPLGATYVTGPDGVPMPVSAPQQPAVAPGEGAAPAIATVTIETPQQADGETAPTTPQGHVVAVREIVPAEPSQPVLANPGPPTPAEADAKVFYADPDPEVEE